MGTTMLFIFSSVFLKGPNSVKVIMALVPEVYVSHLTPPIQYLAQFSRDIDVSSTI